MQNGQTWTQEVGVITFPSGIRFRGRGLSRPSKSEQLPNFGLYLQSRPPHDEPWEMRWLKWRDFWLPSNTQDALSALKDAYQRGASQRVEIACGGGNGRTGTALACIGVLDGMSADDSIRFVRKHYRSHAVETPWQRRFVAKFEQLITSQ